jgi:tRNA1Val (adenine37-N6)-methyltransferase
MKINTDGVLLGAMADGDNPAWILDIGTGTGVIALMLAQIFAGAKIDAVEIDAGAAQTAARNFAASPFADRLTVYPVAFETYFSQFPERKYDLIVSNPPFYVDSLKSPGAKKALAKHTDIDFFEQLIKGMAGHLAPGGVCWLILPAALTETIVELALTSGLYLAGMVNVQSYPHSKTHRVILNLSFNNLPAQISNLTIYKAAGIYSEEYQKLLQSYFIAF